MAAPLHRRAHRAKFASSTSSGSDIEDKYGFVDIFFEPLTLPDGRVLPLRAPAARLEPHVTSGHESTVEAEDTVGDIFVPYYSFWQILRHGKNFVLQAGSEVPARTEATISGQAQWHDRNHYAAPLGRRVPRFPMRPFRYRRYRRRSPDGRPRSEGSALAVAAPPTPLPSPTP